MNKYDLGKQKTLAELCVKKDEEIEALRAENERLKSFIENAKGALRVVRLKTDDEQVYRLVDDALKESNNE